MRRLFRRVRQNEKGAILVEFALVTPLLLMTMAIVLELGAALHQTNLLEKQVAAGAALAARSDYPLTAAATTSVTNLVRTGSVSGGADLLDGWADGAASLAITTQTYSLSGETVPYVRVSASVPYEPMMVGLLDFLGFDDFMMSAEHEEVFIP